MNLVRGPGEFHDHRDFFARPGGQQDAGHGSAVNPAHLHVGSFGQACHIVELRLQFVGGAETDTPCSR